MTQSTELTTETAVSNPKKQHDNYTAMVMFDPEARQLAKGAVDSILKMENIPKDLKGKANDILAIVCMSRQLGMEPAHLMQKCFVINGKIGFESQLMIALANASGIFDGPILHRMNKDKTSCVAYAKIKATGEIVESSTVDMAMVKRFGWDKAKGGRDSMWYLMPEQMLKYRASTFLIRAIAPEVLLGLNSVGELQDAENARNEAIVSVSVANPFDDQDDDLNDVDEYGVDPPTELTDDIVF